METITIIENGKIKIYPVMDKKGEKDGQNEN